MFPERKKKSNCLWIVLATFFRIFSWFHFDNNDGDVGVATAVDVVLEEEEEENINYSSHNHSINENSLK